MIWSGCKLSVVGAGARLIGYGQKDPETGLGVSCRGAVLVPGGILDMSDIIFLGYLSDD
jgi:hypothetical protein